VTHTEGKIDHNVRVVTAIPRPQYDKGQIIEATEVKMLPPVDQNRLAYNAYMRDYRTKKKEEVKRKKATIENPDLVQLVSQDITTR
jgi:hypothetical protein